jgi:hypothetical protein
MTRWWREMDSNHRYPVEETPLCGLPPFHPRNSPSATKTDFFATGTDGSNPSPSSEESSANLTFSLELRHHVCFGPAQFPVGQSYSTPHDVDVCAAFGVSQEGAGRSDVLNTRRTNK